MTATVGRCAVPAAVIKTQPRSLRADACRNRDAILAAARDVFARQGLQAPLEDIARQAGVGIATLYRRFPTREQLVAAALLEKVGQYADVASEALADPDPWAGFARFVRRSCALQANDRGLSDLLSLTLPASDEIEQLRATVYKHVTELAERAKAAGRLRPDFVTEDLLFVLIANAAVAHVSGPDAPRAWQRLAALFLDAFQHTGGDCLPAAPTAAELSRGMARLAVERRLGALQAAPAWPS
jgi:AcrR family transcriptional regulator